MHSPSMSHDFFNSTRTRFTDEVLPLDMPLRSRAVLIALACALLAALYQLIIYPAFLSPLSRIPAAHWSCHVLPFWLLWAKACERENRSVLAGHKKKGPMLRIAPNVLHINSAEGIKAIYVGDFPRSHFYWAAFRNYEY